LARDRRIPRLNIELKKFRARKVEIARPPKSKNRCQIRFAEKSLRRVAQFRIETGSGRGRSKNMRKKGVSQSGTSDDSDCWVDQATFGGRTSQTTTWISPELNRPVERKKRSGRWPLAQQSQGRRQLPRAGTHGGGGSPVHIKEATKGRNGLQKPAETVLAYLAHSNDFGDEGIHPRQDGPRAI